MSITDSHREKTLGTISPASVPLRALLVVELTSDQLQRVDALAKERSETYDPIDGGVLFGGLFAVGGAAPALIETHLRVNLLGFLGLMIVGTSFQFYPPRLGAFPGSSNRSASVAIAALACGLAIEVLGVAAASAFAPVATSLSAGATALGRWLTLLGAVGYASLVASVFAARSN